MDCTAISKTIEIHKQIDALYPKVEKDLIQFTKGDDRPMHRILTIGYEGREVQEFVSLLKDHAVTRVIDVREKPQS